MSGEKTPVCDEIPKTEASVVAVTQDGNPDTLYTVFTAVERWLITIIMGTAMFFSPMTANVYFPAMPALAEATSSTIQAINLTITSYIVLQGISPLFVGDLADKFGRRPIYLFTFTIYVAASLGLALNKSSYTVLITLRTLQSAGCSATAAISYGVLADVAMPSKRGAMMGAAMLAANTGPTVGPLLGGVITDQVGWHWIFWFLTILGGCFLLVVLLLFPETSRKIVDNGSVADTPRFRPLLSLICQFPHNATRSDPPKEFSRRSLKSSLSLPNPGPALRIIFYPDAALVLLLSAIHYTAYYCVQATMPVLFTSAPYHLTSLQVGLTYISIGIGVALGGYVNGKTIDYNYRVTAKKIGFAINTTSGDNLAEFPIEKARTRFCALYVPLHAVLLCGYGWIARYRSHLHIAVPLILQFWLGFLQTCIVQTFNTLLVDIFVKKPSTASAAGNITRCAMSAAGVAAVGPLTTALGWGGVFTILAVACGAVGGLALAGVRRWGMQWRRRRE